MSHISIAFSSPGNPALGESNILNQIYTPFEPRRRKVSWYSRKTVRLEKINTSNGIAFAFSNLYLPVAHCLLDAGLIRKDGKTIQKVSCSIAWCDKLKKEENGTRTPECESVSVLQYFWKESDEIEHLVSGTIDKFEGTDIFKPPWFYSRYYNKYFPIFAFNNDNALLHIFDVDSNSDEYECVAEIAKLAPFEAKFIENKTSSWATALATSPLPPVITRGVFVSLVSIPSKYSFKSDADGKLEFEIAHPQIAEDLYGIVWRSTKTEKYDLKITHNNEIIIDNIPENWLKNFGCGGVTENGWRVWSSSITSSLFPPPLRAPSTKDNQPLITFKAFTMPETNFIFEICFITLKILNLTMLK